MHLDFTKKDNLRHTLLANGFRELGNFEEAYVKGAIKVSLWHLSVEISYRPMQARSELDLISMIKSELRVDRYGRPLSGGLVAMCEEVLSPKPQYRSTGNLFGDVLLAAAVVLTESQRTTRTVVDRRYVREVRRVHR